MNDDLDLDDLHNDDEPINKDDNGNTLSTNELPVNEPESNNEPVSITDGIAEYLHQYNIEGGMLTIDDENGQPTQKHYSELQPEELFNVLNSLAEVQANNLEHQLGLQEDEVALLNLLRENNLTPEELIEARAQQMLDDYLTNNSDGYTDFDAMSHEEIFATMSRRENPELTEAELAQDLDTAKRSSMFEKNMELVRKQFISEVNEQRELETKKQAAEEAQLLEQERAEIVDVVQKISHVAGFPVSDDIKNEVLSSLLEVNEHGDSLFLGEVFSDPKKLFETAWYYKNAEKYFDALTAQFEKDVRDAFKRGQESVKTGLPSGRFSGVVPAKDDNKQDPGMRRQESSLSMNDLHAD